MVLNKYVKWFLKRIKYEIVRAELLAPSSNGWYADSTPNTWLLDKQNTDDEETLGNWFDLKFCLINN